MVDLCNFGLLLVKFSPSVGISALFIKIYNKNPARLGGKGQPISEANPKKKAKYEHEEQGLNPLGGQPFTNI